MTPTPQKSPQGIIESIYKEYSDVIGADYDRSDYLDSLILEVIINERTAYNALLDKVQRVEAERDDLKNRVDSEYDRGVEDARKVAENTPNPNYGSSKAEPHWKLIAEAILKLRRV